MLVNQVLHYDVEKAKRTDEGAGHREHYHHGEDHQLSGVMFSKPELVAHSSVDGSILSRRLGDTNLNHEPVKTRGQRVPGCFIKSYRRKSGTLKSSRLVPMKADVTT